MNTVNFGYSGEAIPEPQVLDVLLCSGNGFLSKRIQRYNQLLGVHGPAAQISHVALVGPTADEVFEATTINAWAGKRGVQINRLSDWLRNYDGQVWRRPLIWPERFCGAYREWLIQSAIDRMRRLVGTPYENGIPGALELALCGIEWKWFRSVFDTQNRLHTKSLHCSESAVDVYQESDLAGLTIRANKCPPYQFWPGGAFERALLCGIRLGEPVRMK